MQEVADKLNDAFQQQYSFSYNKYSGLLPANTLRILSYRADRFRSLNRIPCFAFSS